MDSGIDHLTADANVALPMISGARWFGPESRPFLLRVELPLMLEEMVAAVYGVVEPEDIESDEDLCGSVAVTLLIEGLPALAARAAKLRKAEQSGTVESPEFLAMCRQSVARLLTH